MDNSFLAYMQHLELIAFFSGYPLIYAVAFFIAGNNHLKNNLKSRVVSLLPFSYALMGALYAGLQLKKLYPDYSFENIQLIIQQPYLVIWGLLSILFWIPVLAQKKVLSLIHSLVFFFFLAKDLFLQFSSSIADNNIVSNDMKIYTLSLLFNLASLALILLLSFLFIHYKRRSIFRSHN
ncbi:hypothetical protein FRZ67_22150 [Panacibacter ginsenosidivorans]|uniref:Uncharacterized protein n=1 Tax=Panacibacter ginsenosidivorans TaxID=1813871 RepID=A0A5B8VEB8_9BACT|nr:hypothetical protein [Panacibacter ginsenosidivorans]QEC69867.1 hypothetical protein FRZ67_22150 [Panacibacter ginsenosidivorans]